MFYSASQSLMIVQAQAQERANIGPGSPAAKVDRQRRPQSQEIDGARSAAAPVRARCWPIPRANVARKALESYVVYLSITRRKDSEVPEQNRGSVSDLARHAGLLDLDHAVRLDGCVDFRHVRVSGAVRVRPP